MSSEDTLSFDVVVVGGGSSGCVVAARLSRDRSCRVLLIEAGPGFTDARDFPPDLLDARVLPVGPGSPWTASYAAELTPDIPRLISRGRVLGGSGAVNGGYFVRARPRDFEAWPSTWSYDDVLPYFRVSETDHDFEGEQHGRGGPMPVSRTAYRDAGRTTEWFVDAALGMGFDTDDDKNDRSSSGGVGPVPLNVCSGTRVNSALAYLLPVMDRPNLTVLPETTALAVLFDRTVVRGVKVSRQGTVSEIQAPTVVLSAGAIRTPQLLMCSGVGPADHLSAHGISVVADHPQVGLGFSDHPEVGVYYRTSISGDTVSPLEAVLHVDDLEIRPYTASFDRMIPGLNIADPMIGVGLMRSDSRGDITLLSADPTAAPFVRYRYLESSADRRSLSEGLDLVGELLGAASAVAEIELVEVVGDRLHARLGTSLHLSGSCAMGGDDAVLDDSCRVRGLEGLRVVDTSAIPVVPSRGPHATAIMLAERASELIAGSVA